MGGWVELTLLVDGLDDKCRFLCSPLHVFCLPAESEHVLCLTNVLETLEHGTLKLERSLLLKYDMERGEEGQQQAW